LITTTYVGATDAKAVELWHHENTQSKISYNTRNEGYMLKHICFKEILAFIGYIGSSNFSRSALTDGLEWNLKSQPKKLVI
jgi:HKD family nuclease